MVQNNKKNTIKYGYDVEKGEVVLNPQTCVNSLSQIGDSKSTFNTKRRSKKKVKFNLDNEIVRLQDQFDKNCIIQNINYIQIKLLICIRDSIIDKSKLDELDSIFL